MDRFNSIVIAKPDFERLRALVEQNLEGRNADAAELLDSELSRAQVVPVDEVPENVVTMNSRVVFEDEARGVRREIVLAYPSGADASAGRISVLAPVGAALLGLAVDDAIDWPMPGGRPARLRIVSVCQAAGAEPRRIGPGADVRETVVTRSSGS